MTLPRDGTKPEKKKSRETILTYYSIIYGSVLLQQSFLLLKLCKGKESSTGGIFQIYKIWKKYDQEYDTTLWLYCAKKSKYVVEKENQRKSLP